MTSDREEDQGRMDESMQQATCTIDVGIHGYKRVNEQITRILTDSDQVILNNVFGQRYLGTGMPKGKKMTIHGTPGNDMAAYLEGGELEIFGNAQEAVGNTMNGGRIIIHGHSGDALGYAMRDGEIYVEKDVGYRAGIHMKEYKQAKPVLVIGGTAGSFLAEYMAGGIIILLGLGTDAREKALMGDYFAIGIHGGAIYVRGEIPENLISKTVVATKATAADKETLKPYLEKFCTYFGSSLAELLDYEYTKVVAASSRPFKNLYVNN
jgi:glutamate synthase domain-containing protein 3